MRKIYNLAELRTIPACYIWVHDDWSGYSHGYSIWYWDGEDGLQEQAPTDMADHRSGDRITEEMFPMYVIPDPPAKPGVVDAEPEIRRLGQQIIDDISRASKRALEAPYQSPTTAVFRRSE